MTAIEILRAARERIATQPIHPVKSFGARADGRKCYYDDPGACCYCALGAVYKALGAKGVGMTLNRVRAVTALYSALFDAAKSVLEENGLSVGSHYDLLDIVTHVNDDLGRGAALTMFDRALQALGDTQTGGCINGNAA